ncbi:MAG: acyltransferase family protein [Gammaproteobacteria bacterium]
MDYRREIDGLRAVAVLPVILFHAGFSAFGGGFVGVDVFFVISGYLITSIILSEIEQGSFSIVNFYERRTRRILPALFLVTLFCLPFAWLWLLPADMVSFTQSLIAASTFSSNILFWRTSGYWGAANELVPLLHTWSLAVEEQYYVIFPLFLMYMWRFRRSWILGSFAVIAIASLAIAQWGAHYYPSAAFFLIVTRAWELAIGAMIAFCFLYRQKAVEALLSRLWLNNLMSLVGLLLIGYAVFMFDKSVPFPGLHALVPTVGTGLIIMFSSPKTLVGRLLGLKLLVGIGLVSYSAYLWHVPLFAFAKYRSPVAPGLTVLLALSLLSIVLAYLSWRYFEKPFRNKTLFDRRKIFIFAGVGTAFFILVGLAGQLYNGWPQRMDERLQVLIEDARMKNAGRELCLHSEVLNRVNDSSCMLVKSTDKLAYLIGDSHAIAMTDAVKPAFEHADIGLVRLTERGCPPVRGVYVYESEADKLRCYSHNNEVYSHLKNNADVDYIVMVSRWAFYMEGLRFDNGEGGVEHAEKLLFDIDKSQLVNGQSPSTTLEQFKQAYTRSIEELLATGKKLILVYPIPEAGWHVPRHITSSYLSNPASALSPGTGSTSYDVYQHRNRFAFQALDGVEEHPNLVRVFPEKLFCNSFLMGRCIVQTDDGILYSDDDHLSNVGSELVITEIIKHLN